jgi:hypothetical protein
LSDLSKYVGDVNDQPIEASLHYPLTIRFETMMKLLIELKLERNLEAEKERNIEPL